MSLRWRKPDSNHRSLSGISPIRAVGGETDVGRRNGRSLYGGTYGSVPSSRESQRRRAVEDLDDPFDEPRTPPPDGKRSFAAVPVNGGNAP